MKSAGLSKILAALSHCFTLGMRLAKCIVVFTPIRPAAGTETRRYLKGIPPVLLLLLRAGGIAIVASARSRLGH